MSEKKECGVSFVSVEVQVESRVYFDIDGEGNPCVAHCVGLRESDELESTEDVDIDGLFDGFIQAYTIPGGTARQEHVDTLLSALSKWESAIFRAKEKVLAMPLFKDS